MHIITVGLSHKTAPVEIRERLAVPESRLGEALTRLCSYPGIKEGLLLSTCNRVEVYAVVDAVDAGYHRVQEFLADTHLSLSSEQLTPHLYWHTGDRAIAHLFRVASSLDSMIVGESQILGQIKDAYDAALTHKATGVVLNKVVKKAISVAKRVRTETKIAETAVSVSYAAVELAKKIFSNLSERTVLLVGAGEMAKLAAKHFVVQGVRHIRVTTRNPVNAIELAKRFNGVPVPFDDFPTEMIASDILLCSTGASHYLITPEQVQYAVRQRMNRPIFLIDISVPRNIDPAVRHIDNAFLFDIDDLKLRVEQNREERLREAEKAESMVAEEVGVLQQWMKSLEVTPTIVALRSKADAVKKAEMERLQARLNQLSPQDQEMVESLASAIVNKLLHGTMVTLKAEADSSSGALFVEAARRFFNLEEAAGSVRTSARCTRPEAISGQAEEEASYRAQNEEGDRVRADQPVRLRQPS
ncbi:MAG TPA: glutamyl-tRNA reductase [Nitrospiraceae bacterium]|nr:glutamyl-tRNA reductase [Nitrospiraceae bacterium]